MSVRHSHTPMRHDETVAALVARLRTAESVCVLTGSGISAESGIPTFRGQGGLWQQFRAEELATPQAFGQHPEVVWSWYRYRRRLVRKAAPNAGHLALARMEQLFPQFAIATQNVDGLHQRAGSASVFELHGNIFVNRCSACGMTELASAVSDDEETVPFCSCGGKIRPGVVWFGERLPVVAFEAAYSLAQRCEVFLSIGTSSLVYPAASLAEVAKANGALLVEINPDPGGTPLTARADYCFPARSGEILPRIVEKLSCIIP